MTDRNQAVEQVRTQLGGGTHTMANAMFERLQAVEVICFDAVRGYHQAVDNDTYSAAFDASLRELIEQGIW